MVEIARGSRDQRLPFAATVRLPRLGELLVRRELGGCDDLEAFGATSLLVEAQHDLLEVELVSALRVHASAARRADAIHRHALADLEVDLAKVERVALLVRGGILDPEIFVGGRVLFDAVLEAATAREHLRLGPAGSNGADLDGDANLV